MFLLPPHLSLLHSETLYLGKLAHTVLSNSSALLIVLLPFASHAGWLFDWCNSSSMERKNYNSKILLSPFPQVTKTVENSILSNLFRICAWFLARIIIFMQRHCWRTFVHDCVTTWTQGKTLGDVSGYLKAHRRESLIQRLRLMCPVPGNKIDGCVTHQGDFISIKLKTTKDFFITLSKELNWLQPQTHQTKLPAQMAAEPGLTLSPGPTGSNFKGVIHTSRVCNFLNGWVLSHSQNYDPCSYQDERFTV